MIGSKRTAFPRLSALVVLADAGRLHRAALRDPVGRFPTGWTGYAPLSNQATQGMDSYLVAFSLMGLSMILAGINILATVICYQAPGMRWSRLPISYGRCCDGFSDGARGARADPGAGA